MAPRAAFLIATTVASSLSETNLQSPPSNLHCQAHMIAIVCTIVLMWLAPSQAPTRPEWDDPAVLHVNAEKPHATMTIYPSAEAVRSWVSIWGQVIGVGAFG